MVKNIVLTTLLSFILILTSFTEVEKVSFTIKKIIIDAGHGGKDPGTHGSVAIEKDVALNIAKELGSTISRYLPEVEVIYTRDDDTFVPLEDRAQLANKNGADLFISIHCNAVERNQDNIYGTETYVMGLHTSEKNFEVAKRENAVILYEENNEETYEGFDPNSPESYILFTLYQNAYLENSLNLADKIETQFKDRVGRKSHGVKQAGFWVLYRTGMPSVLIEVGYLTNKKEEKFLNDPLGQTYIASGIFRAFRDFKTEIEANN